MARVRSTQFTVKAPAIALTGLYSPQVQLQPRRQLAGSRALSSSVRVTAADGFRYVL